MSGTEFVKAAVESRAKQLEAAIGRFRECGVEIERFSIVERPKRAESILCIDGVAHFSWRAIFADGRSEWAA